MITEHTLKFSRNQTVYNYTYVAVKFWKDIVREVTTADIIIAQGHGSYGGHFKFYGGIKNILELKVKPNVKIIYNGVCTAAGSSAMDTEYLDYKEAKERSFTHFDIWNKTGAKEFYAFNQATLFETLIKYIKGDGSLQDILLHDLVLSKRHQEVFNFQYIIYSDTITINNEEYINYMVETVDEDLPTGNFFDSSYFVRIDRIGKKREGMIIQ